MRIDQYKFGNMTVDGRRYTKDLIITPTGIVENWWRKEGHKLVVDDIEQFLGGKGISNLIVGTGRFGMMKVSDEVRDYCRNNGVKLTISPTAKAVNEFNKATHPDRTAAAFHLTC